MTRRHEMVLLWLMAIGAPFMMWALARTTQAFGMGPEDIFSEAGPSTAKRLATFLVFVGIVASIGGVVLGTILLWSRTTPPIATFAVAAAGTMLSGLPMGIVFFHQGVNPFLWFKNALAWWPILEVATLGFSFYVTHAQLNNFWATQGYQHRRAVNRKFLH